MELNIRNLLIGKPVRLRYVKRFSTCRVMNAETVAEHSYYVALYTLMICEWCNLKNTRVDTGKALIRAILHDLEEAATGDVPRTFKYSDEGLRKHLDEVALKGLKSVVDNLWDSERMTKWILTCWLNAKDDTVEGCIVEFADFLSVLSYIYEEIRASNIIMREHVHGMHAYYEKFTDPRFYFLWPLIQQARQILFEEIFSDAE